MAGLLGDVLPFLYSQGDRAKRYVGGLLGDPMGTITREVNNGNDRAGAMLGLLGQAANEGMNYGPATQKMAGMLADAYNPVAATVWHGSPHKFNKFDSSKIGTGEGAQAYGHGLYLAESPKVAGSYSGKLSSELSYNGRAMQRESGRNSRDSAAWALYLADGDKAAAKASGLAKPELIDALDPAKLKPGGQLYKVDLPDETIGRMLDWDKPLSQQSEEVRNLIAQRGPLDDPRTFGFKNPEKVKGADIYSILARGSQAKPGIGEAGVSEAMRQAGIPGIRYLDGGSRGAGTGTRNYVVFPGNESLLTILERNGLPLP